jgi:hypothetical protein
MKAPALSQQDRAFIEDLVLHAKSSEKVFETLLHNLFNTFSSDDELMKYVHSMKWRIKMPTIFGTS